MGHRLQGGSHAQLHMFILFWDAEGREIQNIVPAIVITTDVAVLQNSTLPRKQNFVWDYLGRFEISICKLKVRKQKVMLGFVFRFLTVRLSEQNSGHSVSRIAFSIVDLTSYKLPHVWATGLGLRRHDLQQMANRHGSSSAGGEKRTTITESATDGCAQANPVHVVHACRY